MENLEDFKIILEILVIITTLAQTFPPLAIVVGLATLYFLVEDELSQDDETKDEEK